MRWKKTLWVPVILSIAYFIIAGLNFMGPLHSPLTDLKGPTFHPIACAMYLGIALVVTWSIYLSPKFKSKETSFFTLILVGIFFIFIGLFVWKIAEKMEDAVQTQQTQ